MKSIRKLLSWSQISNIMHGNGANGKQNWSVLQITNAGVTPITPICIVFRVK